MLHRISLILSILHLSFHLHFSFCSLEFSLFSLFFLTGLKCANTYKNCRKFTLSLNASPWKNELTILSPRGLMAISGMRKKSSLLKVPQSPRSSEVNREYSLSIWLGVTKTKELQRQKHINDHASM